MLKITTKQASVIADFARFAQHHGIIEPYTLEGEDETPVVGSADDVWVVWRNRDKEERVSANLLLFSDSAEDLMIVRLLKLFERWTADVRTEWPPPAPLFAAFMEHGAAGPKPSAAHAIVDPPRPTQPIGDEVPSAKGHFLNLFPAHPLGTIIETGGKRYEMVQLQILGPFFPPCWRLL